MKRNRGQARMNANARSVGCISTTIHRLRLSASQFLRSSRSGKVEPRKARNERKYHLAVPPFPRHPRFHLVLHRNVNRENRERCEMPSRHGDKPRGSGRTNWAMRFLSPFSPFSRFLHSSFRLFRDLRGSLVKRVAARAADCSATVGVQPSGCCGQAKACTPTVSR
jgi:hypothetical protein